MEAMLAVVVVVVQHLADAAHFLLEAWSGFMATTSASLRQALLTFLFPTVRLDEGMDAVAVAAQTWEEL